MAAWVGGLPWGVCQHSILAESNAPYSIPLRFTGLLVSPIRSLAKVRGPNRMPETYVVKSHLQHPLAMWLWTGTSLYPSVCISIM